VWFIIAHAFGGLPRESRVQRLLGSLAPLTLGIYLVHPLVREFLFMEGYLGKTVGGFLEWGLGIHLDGYRCLRGYRFDSPDIWLGIGLGTLLLAVGSTALTYIISRVPGLRRIVG